MPVHHDVFLSHASAGEPAAEGPAREALAPRLDERHPPRPIAGAAHRKKPRRRSRIAWAVALVLALGGAQAGCRNRTGDAAADMEWPASSLEPILPIEEGGAVAVAFGSESKTPAAGHLGIPAGGVIVTNAGGRALRADEILPLEGPFGPDMRPGLQPDLLKDEPLPGREGRIADPAVGAMRQSAEPLLVAEGRVGGVAYSPDGKTLFAGYGGRGDFRMRRAVPAADFSGVVLWDAAARKRLADAPLPVREGFVRDVALGPDWKALAVDCIGLVGGPVGAVLRDAAARYDLVDDPSQVKECSVWCVALSHDGKTLAASYGLVGAPRDNSGGVVLWDTVTRRRLADIPLVVKEGFVRGVAFSPDGKTLAAGYARIGGGSGMVLWDVAARKRMAHQSLPVRLGVVSGLAFSPDGKTLATGYAIVPAKGDGQGDGGVVILWDAPVH